MIPALKENITWQPIYDHKKLFDLGIEVENLKQDRPFLENMIYSPLSSPWTFYSVITGSCVIIVGLFITFLCCFKGHISCRNKDSKTDSNRSNFNNSDILDVGIIGREYNARKQKRVNELLCNPTRETQERILLDPLRCGQTVPKILESDEDCLVSNPENVSRKKVSVVLVHENNSKENKILEKGEDYESIKRSTIQKTPITAQKKRRTINY